MAPGEDWLSATWTFVRTALPVPPASVVELGCGSSGGLVPRLIQHGYDAVGIDPGAPAGNWYQRVKFEQYRPPRQVGAVIASTSIHHVNDVDIVLDRIKAALLPGGTAVIIEWAHERFDETTARWCFARLPRLAPGDEPGWLQSRRDAWLASGEPWDAYFPGWVTGEQLHPGEEIISKTDMRLQRLSCTYAPYFFADLEHTSEPDEQAAIDSGQIQATGLRYVGRIPAGDPAT